MKKLLQLPGRVEMYAKWFLLVFANFVAILINLPSALLVAFFVQRDGRLPNWLSWFQTPDTSSDGDPGWKTEHWQWRFKLPMALATYVGRVGWLWRNPVYGFATSVLGAKMEPGDSLAVAGDPLTSNRPIHAGTVRRTLWREGEAVYWQFYYVRRWSATRCLRINLGWKLWDYAPGRAANFTFVCSINPLMGLSEA
jgi:hypothetical protein